MSSMRAHGGLAEMPSFAFGTMEYVDGSHAVDEMEMITAQALRRGVRHLDCAELYASTEAVGRAITAAEAIPRDTIWITSKLRGLPCGEYTSVKARLVAHLSKLGVAHVDLLLMHWPGPEDCDFGGSPEEVAAKCSWQFFENNVVQAWQNMKELQKEGLCRHIGVSNFYRAHLDFLVKAEQAALPFANQIYIDACHPEDEFVQHMQSIGVKVMAYRPLTFLGAVQMAADMGDTTGAALDELAKKAGAADIRQVVLAWLLKRGIHVVTKTSSEANLDANLAAASIQDNEAFSKAECFTTNELVDMCGGSDEYASAFKAMS